MEKNVGRNDPCPCGSGKKFKNCCLSKKGGSGVKRKLTATWVNQPVKHVNLIERTFGAAIASTTDKPPQAQAPLDEPTVKTDDQESNSK